MVKFANDTFCQKFSTFFQQIIQKKINLLKIIKKKTWMALFLFSWRNGPL